MVFYVQNRTGVPIQVTLDRIATPDKPNRVQLTISAKTPAGRHMETFRLQNPLGRAVPRVNFMPEPLVVINQACARYHYGYDRDGDLVFAILELFV